jgi:hypothetical protein
MADDAQELERHNLRFLAGQVHALVGFCIAAINTHRSPAELGLHLDAIEHVTLAHVESSLVAEDFLDGVRNVFDRLKKTAAEAEAKEAAETSDWEEAAAAQLAEERRE